MNDFWKGAFAKEAEESDAEESAESPEEKAEEFAAAFVIRGVDRLAELGLVAVRIAYVKDRNSREYEYFIPFHDYTWDKKLIASQILQQHKDKKKPETGTNTSTNPFGVQRGT